MQPAILFTDFTCEWADQVTAEATALAAGGLAHGSSARLDAAAEAALGAGHPPPPPQPATAADTESAAARTLAYLLEQTVDVDQVVQGGLSALLSDLGEWAAWGGAAPASAAAARAALLASAEASLRSAKTAFLPSLARNCGVGPQYAQSVVDAARWSSVPGYDSAADLSWGLAVLAVDLGRDLRLLPRPAVAARLGAALAAGDALIHRCLGASAARWTRLEGARAAAAAAAAARTHFSHAPVGGWGSAGTASTPPASPRASPSSPSPSSSSSGTPSPAVRRRPPPPPPAATVDPGAPLGGRDVVSLFLAASADLWRRVEGAADGAGAGGELAAVQAGREAGGCGWAGGGEAAVVVRPLLCARPSGGGGGLTPARGPSPPSTPSTPRGSVVGGGVPPLTLEKALEGLDVAPKEGGRSVRRALTPPRMERVEE